MFKFANTVECVTGMRTMKNDWLIIGEVVHIPKWMNFGIADNGEYNFEVKKYS
ncbi:hypothetical protein ACIQ34_12050 [Ureibacillus sp. NPDC094379]